MSEVDLQSLPPLLTADIQRTQSNGLPTEALQDWEQFQQNWMATNVVALDKKLTEVSGSVGDLSGTVTDLEAVVANPDGSLTAQKLSTVAAQSSTNAGKITDLTAVVAAPDGSLVAGRLTDISTTVSGQTATISELTDSVNGIAVQKVLKATLNGATGGYEFSGVQNADGTGATFAMSFTANNFTLTDPSYNGGAPGNVFSYSTELGAFNFNVPVKIRGQDIASKALFDLGNPTYAGGEVAIGLGMTSNSGQHFAGCVANFNVDGDCVVDVTFQAYFRISAIGGTGNFVNLDIDAYLDGRFIQRLYSTNGAGFFGNGSVTPTNPVTVKLFLTGANALTPGTHQLYFATNYSGSSGTCSAYMENGTNIAFMVFKAN